ncbi:hypothetical protein Q4511_16300 [Paracoccus sp. 1_MG-2023]|uniref:hypothetical protein n=1 Tax=unclassified Paracoccus (in: a-proteobacteria) TaxID=2688777 RepID=UPI001C082A45|nr:MULTISPECIES: hypothetical protein [unclassified Paracoccus (in: a-proteobacteria)]MBU2958912.1 hypothetical protein [Paracoccus sp. C2R09]MDO6670466.1 hypothetical protein [Paracoccus sp. 1_MG-2023]
MLERFSFAAAFLIGVIVGPQDGAAIQISSSYQEATQFMPASLTVKLSGEIVQGDATALEAELLRYESRPINHISFEFDSPGGALMEGIRIGQVIALRPEDTSSRIAGSSAPICASACVYAYIGSDFRFIEEGAELGVHQFYTQNELTGSDALAMGQELTSIILTYLQGRGVATEFLADIVSARGESMVWVNHQRLADLGVVSQGVKGQWVEYVNYEGEISLRVEQDAFVGQNKIIIGCGDQGPYGMAFLEEPPMPFAGPFMVHAGGYDHTIHEFGYIEHGNGVTIAGFQITPQVAAEIAGASAIGGKVFNLDKTISYGFSGEVVDPKIRDMVDGCMRRFFRNAPPPSPTPVPIPRMTRQSGMDLRGADLLANGIRNISLDECERQCLAASDCAAVSYVIDMQWCWPKGYGGAPIQDPGIISSFR